MQMAFGVLLGMVALAYVSWSFGVIKSLRERADANFRAAVESKTETLTLTRELAAYKQLIGQPFDVRLNEESINRIAQNTAMAVADAQKRSIQ